MAPGMTANRAKAGGQPILLKICQKGITPITIQMKFKIKISGPFMFCMKANVFIFSFV